MTGFSKFLKASWLSGLFMTGSGFGKLSTTRLLIATAVIAIVSGASLGLGVGYVIHYDAPTTRTFYLFDRSLPFNETVFNIPPRYLGP